MAVTSYEALVKVVKRAGGTREVAKAIARNLNTKAKAARQRPVVSNVPAEA